MSAQQQEKKNRIMAALYTFGVHAAIFCLMFFIIAWRVPNPPFPGSGIELNFGTDAEGSGDVQPETPVGTENAQAEQREEQAKPEETKQEVQETPAVKQEVKPVETKQQEEEIVSGHEESPVVVKEKKEETKKPVEPKIEEKPKVEEKTKVEEKPLAVYNPGGRTEDKTGNTGREGKPGNQGDDKNKVGDKGNPQGTLDSKALYGNPGTGNGGNGGSGGGAALDLNGWNWDNIPKPNIPDNETGRIVFEIEVDDNGELIKYTKLTSTVSAAAERACIAAIDRLTFTKKSDAKVPSVSKGRITFVIRAQ